MREEKYNKLFDTWMLAKPSHIVVADWAAMWTLVSKGTYIDRLKVDTTTRDWDWNTGLKKEKEAEDKLSEAPW